MRQLAEFEQVKEAFRGLRPSVRRERAEQQRDAVYSSINDLIDGYIETSGEVDPGPSAWGADSKKFSQIAEGTNVSVHGSRTSVAQITRREVVAELPNGRIKLEVSTDDPDIRWGMGPLDEPYPPMTVTYPTQQFAAVVNAIWPTIDLSPIMKTPTLVERARAAKEAIRARQLVGRK